MSTSMFRGLAFFSFSLWANPKKIGGPPDGKNQVGEVNDVLNGDISVPKLSGDFKHLVLGQPNSFYEDVGTKFRKQISLQWWKHLIYLIISTDKRKAEFQVVTSGGCLVLRYLHVRQPELGLPHQRHQGGEKKHHSGLCFKAISTIS